MKKPQPRKSKENTNNERMNVMFEKVKEILGEFADTDVITPDASLTADLGLTSFDVISIIMAFEDEFDIEIPDRDVHKMLTVNDVVEYVESKI